MAYGASADLVVRIITKAEDAGAGFTQTQGKMDKFRSGLGKMALPAAIAAGAIVKFGSDAVSSASDLQQAMGGVDAVFGKSSGTIKKWASGAATDVGLSQTAYANMASALGASLKNAGIPMDQVTKKTGEMIKMGADLAATYGGTTEEAVSALTGALRGEADPAERYGLALNATKVNGELAAKGLDKLKGSQGTAAKAATIMRMAAEQSGGAIGQFRREADSAAGSQEIANAKWENAKASLGTALLPMVTKVTSALGKLAGWMGKNTKATQIIIGIVLALAAAILILVGAFKVYDVILRITKAVQAATWLAALGPIALVIAAVLAVIAIFILLYKKCKWFRDFVNAMWAMIKSAAKSAADFIVKVFTSAVDLVAGLWDSIVSAFDTVKKALQTAFHAVAGVFKSVWRVAKAIVVGYFRAWKLVVTTIFRAIRAIFRAVAAVFKSVWRGAVRIVQAEIRGFKIIFTNIMNAIKSAIRAAVGLFKDLWRREVQGVQNIIRGFRTFFGNIFRALADPVRTVRDKITDIMTAGIDKITDLWDGLEDLVTAPFDALLSVIDDVSGAIDTLIGWIGKIHFPSMPGWVDKIMPGMVTPPPAQAASRRGLGAVVPMGQGTGATSGGGGITINVNGALDPESTARQIQRILAGHDRRMGLRTA